jgi:hypothetical protein
MKLEIKHVVFGCLSLAATMATARDAEAQLFYHRQHYHSHSNNYSQPQHYHDSAGHVVDRYGHHVDGYGRHTGAVGLYDQHSAPANYGYGSPYVAGYRGSYSGAAVAPNPSPDHGLPIVIDSPAAITMPINFSLNGRRYLIHPGERQTLTNDRPWTIQFDRGGEYGFSEYGLTPGTYEFEATDRGWELFKLTRSAVVAQPPAGSALPNAPPPAPTPQPRGF